VPPSQPAAGSRPSRLLSRFRLDASAYAGVARCDAPDEIQRRSDAFELARAGMAASGKIG